MSEVYKYAALITLSDDMLIDWGHRGPRLRTIPDSDRWAQLYKDAQPFTFYSMFTRIGPPWEWFDAPAWRSPIVLFPRIDRLQRWRETHRLHLRARLIGARDGWLLREPEEDYT